MDEEGVDDGVEEAHHQVHPQQDLGHCTNVKGKCYIYVGVRKLKNKLLLWFGPLEV